MSGLVVGLHNGIAHAGIEVLVRVRVMVMVVIECEFMGGVSEGVG